MKIILFSRPEIELASDEINALLSSLNENGLDYVVNTDFARRINSQTGRHIPASMLYESFPEVTGDETIMVSYGGDGTFLESVRMLEGRQIPVLGINFGHLGFLANVPKEEIKHAFRELKEHKYSVGERSLLHVEGDFDPAPPYPYAINEFAIQRDGLSMISVDVTVNNEKLATYRGDGVLISTPTGSTAYSLSLGGPIVAPDCRCFVISPIAPHNLTMRPVVIPDDSQIVFRLEGREATSFASLDNQSYNARRGAEFKVRKGEKSIFLVNLQNISFYDTLRNKMMWGLDGRDRRK